VSGGRCRARWASHGSVSSFSEAWATFGLPLVLGQRQRTGRWFALEARPRTSYGIMWAATAYRRGVQEAT